jgi:hypothetical protein
LNVVKIVILQIRPYSVTEDLDCLSVYDKLKRLDAKVIRCHTKRFMRHKLKPQTKDITRNHMAIDDVTFRLRNGLS